jgi:two-component system CheB/CheR fusion protein
MGRRKERKRVAPSRRAGRARPKAAGKSPAGTKPKAAKVRTFRPPKDALIVAIGASAGGLEALKDFFEAMPSDSGMAFIVIQHLEPTHKSQMAAILDKHTDMRVVQAKDRMAVQANTVYTLPADKHLSIRGGLLRLTRPLKHEGIKRPIDLFLRCLAEERHEKAIGIILSGSSGIDGTLGIRAIRSAGGMCMAQDPRTAQFAAMPQSAIDTGLVDYVLPVDQMPRVLLDYARQPYVSPAGRRQSADPAGADGLAAILEILRCRAGNDYRHYKKGTLLRRIQRRMGIRQIAGMSDYLRLLRQDENEAVQLSRDMLIGVSSFFRDPRAFEQLRSDVIVPLAASKDRDEPLRAWVAGCATGEEAYSIAMLLAEEVSAAGKHCLIQVFASDVDEEALETARAGLYPESIAADVSLERLDRFFTHKDQHYAVSRQLREMIVFARHNLLTDPPFSKMDLVSCRNVLIYLEPPAQQRTISTFSFSLNVGGHLFLGKSEGLCGLEDSFKTISRSRRIYRLVKPDRGAAADLAASRGAGRTVGKGARAPAPPSTVDLALFNQQVLLKHFRAGIVLVDARGRILHFYGDTERYLGHAKGQASLNLLDMASPALSAKLRQALDQAQRQDAAATLQDVRVGRKRAPLVNVTVVGVPGRPDTDKLLAVIFEERQTPADSSARSRAAADLEPLAAQLEAEVKSLRAEMASVTQEHESSSEELRAAHEEVMSMNEELQSTNEELETSKEELQSVNEELNTLNSQLNDKVVELTEVNDDMANLFGATDVATIFLDAQLRIKRFTSQATELMKLVPSDAGRPINHIRQAFEGDLAADAARVLQGLSPVEREIRTHGDRWYTLRILPYRTLANRIEGVVVTFSDVTRLKQAEATLQAAKTYAEGIVQTIHEPLVVLDAQLRVVSANREFYQMFGMVPKQVEAERIYDLADHAWDIPALRQLFGEIVPANTQIHDFEVTHDFERIGLKTVLLNARRVEAPGGAPECILLAFNDITERKRAQEELASLNRNLEARVSDRTALAERRAEQLRKLAAELTRSEQRERERLAHVLHDDLQQLLVGARLQVETARGQAQDAKSQESLGLASDLLDQSLAASRSLTTELSPTVLHEGLGAALRWLAGQMAEKHRLAVHVEAVAEVQQDDEGVTVLLFQATRELLFNIVKHARTREATVRLERIEPDRVRIVVEDKGAGFDLAKLDRKSRTGSGLGLFGIRERIEHLGGHLQITSVQGQGTVVTVAAPLRRP